MSVRTQSQLLAEVAANITDPQNRQNTAARVREVCTDIVDTMFDSKQVYEATLTLSSAEILALNSTPIEIVAAPGSGKYICVSSAEAIIETYGGTPYATNTTLVLINPGSGYRCAFNSTILPGTVSNRITPFIIDANSTAGGTQILPNTSLNAQVQTGDPINGNSVVKIKLLYRIVTI